MGDGNDGVISRRQWVGRSMPLLVAAAAGSGWLAPPRAAAVKVTVPVESDHLDGIRTYNIRDFGAKGDGVTLDTVAVQSAIDACHGASGGTVLVPAGVFVIGTVELKSNVTLHLAAQGKLLGTADGKLYRATDIPLSGDSTLGDGNVGMIFAIEAINVTVEGPGTVDGQGFQFHSPVRGTPPPSGIGGARRPYSLLFHRCKNLVIRDIQVVDSAFHAIRVIQSAYVRADGIHIHTRVNGNNDGFHFISCHYVNISNCNIECQDDACALFGSCKFFTINNCSFSTRWSVFRFGGGEAENIAISNCLIYQTYGCPIKMHCTPGTRFENISFSNLVMQDVTGPISIGNGPVSRRRSSTTQAAAQAAVVAGSQPATQRAPGIVRNISFNGIRATVCENPSQLPNLPFTSGYNPGEIRSCIVLNGVGDNFLENISFHDVHVTFGGGGTSDDAGNGDVPQHNGEYFELGRLPAYGLFARNVRGLTMSNIRFEVQKPDVRPAIIFRRVEDAAVNGLSVQGNPQATATVRMVDTKQTLVSAARLLTPASLFLRVEGAASEGIVLDGGDLTKAQKPSSTGDGASDHAVKVRS